MQKEATNGKNKYRISIGMPVYNGENYLEKALDSILVQTFTDFELIISDNASTDRTQEICQTYAAKERRIRYYRHEKNLGAAKNFNCLFELSRGEYFKWAAHDDICAPTFIERCARLLDYEQAVVLCYPKTTFIDAQGEIQGYYADNLNLRSPKPHQRFAQFFDNPGWCHPIFGLIRSSALKRTPLIGNYPRSDRNLLGELALLGEFCEVADHLFYRRIHPKISTEVNACEAELAVWFDPAKKGKLVFSRWRRLLEYFRAIKRAPLSRSEQIRCYMQVGRFVLFPQRWAGLGNDLLKAVKQMMKRPL
jgi:glycosyltransferase involved in cell wall biosynthesis